MNARGVAKFMISGAYAARTVVENYVFPKDEKPQIILKVPAKDVVWNYLKRGRSVEYLDDAIAEYSVATVGESSHERSRRLTAVEVAKRLKTLGRKLSLSEPHKPRKMVMSISGLPVRASIDAICKLPNGQVVAVIFNVSRAVSRDVTHYAKVECEIAWQITRAEMPSISAIWYVDVLSEKTQRKHTASLKGEWRNVETTCDNILMTYRSVMARGKRFRRGDQ